MGFDQMKDTLMFMMYADSTGKNVTVSPRLSYGHTEPSYTSNVTYTAVSGTGISNGTMTAIVKCHNCRAWKGGSINPNDTAANFIFASVAGENLKSNSLSADTMRHSSYGTFTMDLTKVVGGEQVPSVATANTLGTVQGSYQSDHDFSPPIHAALMVLAFFVLMPIGVVILRSVHSVRWHGFNQTFSAVAAVIGVGLGIYCGTEYNRVC